ncbi:hypothetical protein [Actinoallomurus rhizosphaericola]|uniref:hypothetical protein n=1 Tax=Actinoallomurus rhizosphaericola TaxID=2952536 RepID=UPI002091FA9D|nr:hypothetical protein [Actinoallomurus rhizosphaericola]MCO5998332.1 hypothetical protein [Actinoallomurus rhizosphaericola]
MPARRGSPAGFRHVPPGVGDDELDAHNERLARAMQADGRVYLAPAIVDGRTCLRACFVNFRTTPDVVKTVLEVADELGRTFPPGNEAPFASGRTRRDGLEGGPRWP